VTLVGSERTWVDSVREQLAHQLVGRRWLSESAQNVASFELEDFAWLAGTTARWLLLLLRFPGSGKRYFVPLRIDASFEVRESSYDPEFLAALLRAMVDQAALPTDRGRSIECCSGAILGAVGIARPFVPLLEGQSSHCVSELVGGGLVCKVYKHLGRNGGHELAALQRLASTGMVPEVLGWVRYRAVDGHESLGLVTTMLDGEPLHAVLSRQVRLLSEAVVNRPSDVAALIRDHVVALTPVCTLIGTELRRLHRGLNGELPYDPPGSHESPNSQGGGFRRLPGFDSARFIDAMLAQAHRLQTLVTDDHALAPAVGAQVLQILRHLLHDGLAADARPGLPELVATVPHGDLHLSHILVRSTPETARVGFLDISPRAVDPDAPAFATQSIHQDLLSLRRALEYFCFDELMDAIKDAIDITALEASRGVVQQPSRISNLDPGAALLQVLEQWSDQVFDVIERAYCTAARGGTSMATNTAWTALFYLARLLEEFEYNYLHGREFFKYCDCYYLVRFATVSAGAGRDGSRGDLKGA
jgi:1-epi-valienol-7-phosphate kinase